MNSATPARVLEEDRCIAVGVGFDAVFPRPGAAQRGHAAARVQRLVDGLLNSLRARKSGESPRQIRRQRLDLLPV